MHGHVCFSDELLHRLNKYLYIYKSPSPTMHTSQTMAEGDWSSGPLTDGQEEILYNAVRARANLVGPTRLNHGPNGSVSITNGRNENYLPSVSEESEENMVRLLRSVLTFLDESVERAEDKEERSESERKTSPLVTTDTPWFEKLPFMGSVYEFKDLTYQLMPNRSACLVLDVINGTYLTNYEWTNPTSTKLNELCAYIDMECARGTSCVYRSWFPHVDMAGPRMLPKTVIDALTNIPHVAPTAKVLNSCLCAVYSVLGQNKDDEPDIFASSGISLCICCMVVTQMESVLSYNSDLVVNDKVGCLSLLGISAVAEKEPECTSNFFDTSINIHGGDAVFPFKAAQLVVKQYEIAKDDERSSGWRIVKKK